MHKLCSVWLVHEKVCVKIETHQETTHPTSQMEVFHVITSVGSEDNHRTSHLICVTASSGCRAAGVWSNHTPPYFVSCRNRWALPPRPVYTFMAWCLGTGSNRANWLHFVFGRCPLRISPRTPISLQTFSLFYSAAYGRIVLQNYPATTPYHHLSSSQFMTLWSDCWQRHWINANNGTVLPALSTLLPRGSVKITCIFVRLYSCPITKEQSYGTTLASSAMAFPYVECFGSRVSCIVSCVCRS
jgi:hypothetical protein